MPFFGRLIRQKREEQGLTLFALAVKVNMHPQTISKLERTGNCSLKKAITVAAALGLDAIPTK